MRKNKGGTHEMGWRVWADVSNKINFIFSACKMISKWKDWDSGVSLGT